MVSIWPVVAATKRWNSDGGSAGSREERGCAGIRSSRDGPLRIGRTSRKAPNRRGLIGEIGARLFLVRPGKTKDSRRLLASASVSSMAPDPGKRESPDRNRLSIVQAASADKRPGPRRWKSKERPSRIHIVRANEVFLIYGSFFPQHNLSASRKCGLISPLSQFQTLPECFPGIETGSYLRGNSSLKVIPVPGNLGPALNSTRRGATQACSWKRRELNLPQRTIEKGTRAYGNAANPLPAPPHR